MFGYLPAQYKTITSEYTLMSCLLLLLLPLPSCSQKAPEIVDELSIAGKFIENSEQI